MGAIRTDISVTTGAEGFAAISYIDNSGISGRLMFAHCNDSNCSVSARVFLGLAASHTPITIGAHGLPLIMYQTINQGLFARHCTDVTCSSLDPSSTLPVDTAGNVGAFPFATIGADGLPLISYYDTTNQDLKVAHCPNTFCIPYFRRR